MKIFLDSANIESIKKYNEMGILDGVTTNPTLLSKEKGDPRDVMSEIVRTIRGPVSLEVIGTDYEVMMDEAHKLKKYGQNVVVKIPMIPAGLRAVRSLKEDGISTNVTLIFSSNQAILAAKAGAAYISPFIGRLDDNGQDGISIIREISQIFSNYKFETEILVASIRHPLHVIEAGKCGADIVTLPPEILYKMLMHPLTDVGLSNFISDWKKVRDINPDLVF
jgi:transaldolase